MYLSYKQAESNWDCDNARLYLPSVGGSIKRNEATLPNITTDPFYNRKSEMKIILRGGWFLFITKWRLWEKRAKQDLHVE